MNPRRACAGGLRYLSCVCVCLSVDVVGPYFTSSSKLESKFIVSCILQTVFHLYDFRISVLVAMVQAPMFLL